MPPYPLQHHQHEDLWEQQQHQYPHQMGSGNVITTQASVHSGGSGGNVSDPAAAAAVRVPLGDVQRDLLSLS